MAIIVNLLLLIDGLIYDLIGSLFEIFDFLSKVNLFSNDVYSNIIRRIYVVLGLIMMFALAYSLLKAVINPDEFSKGETSFPKLIKNVVVSLAIIAVLPTVFTVAFNIQNSLLNEDTIPKIVLGDEYKSTYLNGGKTIAYNSFMAFLHVNESYCKEEYSDGNDGYDINECEKSIPTNVSNVKWYTLWRLAADKRTFADVKQNVSMGDSIADFNQFGEAVVEGKLSYIMIISTIFGIFLLVVIANFCFDMALRIIKLMFFQIIAPIPVVCRVIPGGKMKDVFPTWIKKTTSTFLDVFIRIFVMYLGIFVILTVTDKWDGIPKGNLSGTQSLVAKALIIMGVVMFIRQAPKLLGDLFHLDTGSMKLGLMDKLAAGGALTAAATLGSAGGMLLRNGASAFKSFKATKGQNKLTRLGAAAKGFASTAAGTLSGATRGFYSSRSAKNWKDVKNATSGAISTASMKKEKRDNYRASHTGANGLDTLLKVGTGHITDTITKARQWIGLDDGLSVLQAEKESYKKFLDNDSETDSTAIDLMKRDPIAQNALLMQAAGGPKMSLNEMKKAIETEGTMSGYDMIGKTVTDFKGNVYTIRSNDDYVHYLSTKEAQYNKAERDLKKYIKRFGYQEDGVQAMTIDVATNDILANTDVSASRTMMNNAAGVNYSSDEMKLRITSMERTAWNSSMAGTSVSDFNNNTITLNSEADFNDYINTLKNQSSRADSSLREYVSRIVASGNYGTIRNSVVADGYTFDVNKVVSDLGFGDGEVQRLNKIHGFSADVRNLIYENPTILEKLNSLLPANKQVRDIDGPDAWDKMDRLINNIKDRNIDINTEINKLLREKENMSGESNKKS